MIVKFVALSSGFAIIAIIVVAVIARSDCTDTDSQYGGTEQTYEFCTIINDPAMPAKFYGEEYIPLQYRLVIEQADDGSYRYRRLDDVLDSANKIKDDG